MTVPLPTAYAREVAAAVARALPRGRWRLPLLAVVVLTAATAGVVGPLALGAVVDAVAAGDRSPHLVVLLAGVMGAAVIVGAALGAVGLVAASHLCESALANLRERMVEVALRLLQDRVERAGTGDLIARAADDVAEVSDAIPRVVPAVVGSAFTIVVTLAGMALIDPRYAVVLAALAPVHVRAVRRYLRTAPAVYAAERAAMTDRSQQLLDALRGRETVRAFGLAESRLARIADASWTVVSWSMRARGIQNLFFARLNAAEFLGMAGLLVAGFALVSTGAGTVGGTTAAMLLFLRLFGPINQLLFVTDDLQSALASLGRIVGVIHADETAVDAPHGDGVTLTAIEHAFTTDHPVLHKVSLRIAPGETVAVVGASGAGKTTLAAIAAGVHTPVRGEVRRPRSRALVTQDVHVFDTTLRENLLLARPGSTDAELHRALKDVGADALSARLPLGHDEPIGASGTPVTPAEAQQIALARVLLADPAFVVLDEATAEAGSSDADRLEEAADTVARGRTALVVAHRLSQASRADRIVLMEGGRITEEGTHDELRLAGGEYARLWAAWSRGR